MDNTAERRARWRKTLYQWHWISSALSLVGMLLFALTGITLNNAGTFESSKPVVTRHEAVLPAALLAPLKADPAGNDAALPAPVRAWLGAQWGVSLPALAGDWSAAEVVVDVQSPGVDALLRIDRRTGRAELERGDRGWVAYLNDLHKGRHAGVAWSWFLDLFAGAVLLFSITGLLILQLHAAARPLVWPITALGLVLPVLLALLLIH
ncbi:MAG: hypothetical protein RJA98_1054 [Pseudomonadota bacterium]|jgi:hypothetical protein